MTESSTVGYLAIFLKEWSGKVNIPAVLTTGRDQSVNESFLYTLYGFTDDRKNEHYSFRNVKEQTEMEDSDKVRKVIRPTFLPEKDKGYDERTGRFHIYRREYNAGIFFTFSCYSIEEDMSYKGKIKKGTLQGKVVAKDIQDYIRDLPAKSTIQVPSNFNGLANQDRWTTHLDGIEIYKNNPSIASKAALSCVTGTLIRNYSVPELYLGQYNALGALGLSHQNGFLVWSDNPDEILVKVNDEWDFMRISVMLNTDIDMVKLNGDRIMLKRENKDINMIFISSPAYNKQGNNGKNEAQVEIIRNMLDHYYLCGVLLALHLHIYNELKTKPIIHLTLVEGQELWAIDSIAKALDKIQGYDVQVNIVMDPLNDKSVMDDIKKKLGIDVGKYSNIFKGGSPFPSAPTPVTRPQSPVKKATPTPVTRPQSPVKKATPTPVTRPQSPVKKATPAPVTRPQSPAKKATPAPRPVAPPSTSRSKAYKKKSKERTFMSGARGEKYYDSIQRNDANDYLIFDDGNFSEASKDVKQALQNMLQYSERQISQVESKIGDKNYIVHKVKYGDDDYIYVMSIQDRVFAFINKYSPWILRSEKRGLAVILYDSNDESIKEYPLKEMGVNLDHYIPREKSESSASDVSEEGSIN